MALEQAEDVLVQPARVPKLDRYPHPPRQPVQEVVEPGIVTFEVGRELDEQNGAMVVQPTVGNYSGA